MSSHAAHEDRVPPRASDRGADAHAVADTRIATAALLGVAGLIHVKAFIEHVDYYWVHGVLFALVAIGQLSLGYAMWRRPVAARVLAAAAVVTLAIVAVWIVSRTAGLPFGPDAGRPEEVGAADTFSSCIELVYVAMIAALLRPGSWLGRRLAWVRGDQAVRLVMALASAGLVAAVLGSHAH